MRIKSFVLALLLAGFLPGFGQYLENPSFEGTILMIGPPPGWYICDPTSTPNVQPGKYNIFLPPSEGMTYLGLLTRDNFTWEDMRAPLLTPLSKDSCYKFKIDLAFQEVLSFTIVDPIVLRVYGSNIVCQKNNVLWQSPPISNLDWETFEFLIHNDEFDITDLILETYYVGTSPYWGYMLLDNIRITPTPSFELGNDTTLVLCENDTLVLDPGPGFNTYLWQDGSTESTYVVDTTGLYWVQAFNAQGCSWTDSIYVTIEEYFELESEMIESTVACEGQEVSLTATVTNGVAPYSYEWLNLPDTTENITVIADSTMFYYVTVTDHCGFTLTDSIKVIVIDKPDIDLGNDTLICPDGNYNLNAGSGYLIYLWQDGSVEPSFNVTEPGIYWVEVTNNFGCVARDSITIDLFPPIPLDLGEDTTLCIGQSVTFYAGEGFADYLWQNNSTDPYFTATNTGLYWVLITDIYGCHATDSVYAEFISPPNINLGNDVSICSGEQLILNAGSGYNSYQWQDNNSSQFYNVTQTGWYWVTVNNNCGEDTDSIYVVVNPQPEPDLGPDTTICLGQEYVLDLGSQYISYLWQDNSTLPFYSINGSGVYSVTVENSYGCFGNDEIVISVSDIQVDLGADEQFCEGETMVLDAGGGFVSYLWQDNSTNQTYTINSSGTFSVSAIDEFGCESSDEVNYSYYPYPNPDLSNLTICEGDTATLQAPAGDYIYYWNGEIGGQSFEVSSPGQYTLTMVNPCDSVSDNAIITTTPVPVIYLGDDDVLIPGQTVELNAGSGFDEYLWQDGSGGQYFTVTASNIDIENPYFYVEVTNGICKGSDTVMIELYQIWVPNVITPNGDGKNDIFKPNPENWSGVNNHHMTVLNRWGEKIWESDDFETGWDGKRNGNYVSEGTYYWILDVYYGPKNIKQTLKGTLSVFDTN